VSLHLPPDRKHWGNLVVEVERQEVGVNHPLGVENKLHNLVVEVERRVVGVNHPLGVESKLHNLAVAERGVAELGRVEVWGCIELEGAESAEVV
jgi:hypothetical protein